MNSKDLLMTALGIVVAVLGFKLGQKFGQAL